MIVQCSNCGTKYNFEDSRFKDGVKVRCTRCKHVFKLSSLDEEDSGYDLPDDFSEDFSLGAKARKEQPPSPKPEWDPDDMNVDIVSAPKKPVDRKTRIKQAVIGLFLVMAIGLAVYLASTRLDGSITIPFIATQEQEEQKHEKTEFSEEDVKDIALENIRQYFVTNDKIGQLFVIEGQAVNNFQVPKSMIKLRASLYDAAGSAVVEKEFLCGNAASLFQLQVSSEEELESTLQSRMGIMSNNKHVEPGSSTPFMVVFYNPPDEVQEFGLEVIEAHDPAP